MLCAPVGTPSQHCRALAQVLVAGDVRGHFSHGLNRLEMYVHDIEIGTTVLDGKPEVVKETSATALVKGNNLLGSVVGNFCNDLAMKKAQESGIGWVVCGGSNHYGIAGWYTIKAVEQGLIDPSALMYQTFTIEHNGECVDMVATHEKEAAKLFGLYLWHKGALNWLEEGNKPVIIHVRNTLISITFSLWRDKEKIYTEATFYKKFQSSLPPTPVPETPPIHAANYSRGSRCCG
ncbi:hypothetical protein OS493_039753 [Desmophyllum pertusum]|uniref:Malate dehydrogenase n=1 Tax=Desmophyllum pertusum TaxID=174260 RepID=A0A9W9ZUU0_9CNID|nr:hypothetical protein OS493_039753 [Desmophyllum pertusum]